MLCLVRPSVVVVRRPSVRPVRRRRPSSSRPSVAVVRRRRPLSVRRRPLPANPRPHANFIKKNLEMEAGRPGRGAAAATTAVDDLCYV